MFNKKLMILAIFFVSLFAVSVVSATENNVTDVVGVASNDTNNVVNVEETFDDIQSVDGENDYLSVTSDGTFKDLANDITNANGELNLTRDYIYSDGDSDYINGIIINKKITINGKGFTINGNNKANAFNIPASNVILKNIKFIKCSNSNNGGAIYWNGGNGNLLNCSFTDCHSSVSKSDSPSSVYNPTSYITTSGSSYGGAVYWNGVSGIISDCDFINCYSSVSSNAHAIANSRDYSKDPFRGTSATTSSTTKSDSYGGAIYWKGSNGKILNCNFRNCYSSSYGASYSTSTFTHYIEMGNTYGTKEYSAYSESYSNSKSYSSIYYVGDNGNILNCNFINPTSSYVCDSESNRDSRSYVTATSVAESNTYGGAIYWSGAYGSISGCNFSGSSHGLNYKDSVYWRANGYQSNCSFNGNYFDYGKYCGKYQASVYPIIGIHTSTLDDNDNIVNFESTQLVNNITVTLYDITDTKILYDQFSISSTDLTSSLNLNNLKEGKYKIELQYSGDNFYSSTLNDAQFNVGKNSSFEVLISDNLVEGDTATINLILNQDAQGKVKIKLSNYTCVEELINGKASFNISNVKGGFNNYKIKYEGDSNYNPIYIIDNFNVLYKSNLNLILNENYIFDETIPVEYTITPNCTGIISVLVDNVFKNNITVGDEFKLENISVGEHNIVFIYNGDEYFSTCYESNTFTVSKADSSININSSNLAGDVLFELIINEKATGNITLSLNNNIYSGYIINGKSNIFISNLVAGDYDCVINYEGDSNYNPLNQNYHFQLQLKQSNIQINVNDVTLGDPVDVGFDLTVGATGTISVYLNNTLLKTISINEKITIPDLVVGGYSIKLVYNGDDYYESCESIKTFNVLKIKPTIDRLTVSSTSSNITFGDVVNVNYHMTEGITGHIVMYVDSILYKTVNVGDSLTVSGLNAGTHNIQLVYSGDENYESCGSNVTFEVLKQQIDISNAATIVDAVYGKTKIIFTNPLDGILNVFLSNNYQKSYNILGSKDNNLDLSDANAGDHEITYIFIPNNKNYQDATYVDNLKILKTLPKFNINVQDINYNQNFKAEITFLSDVTGTMNITLKNENDNEIDKKINLNLANNVLKYEINKLDASKYYLTFSYSGDGNYYSSNGQATFEVFKIDPIMYFDVTNATYGQTARIVVNSAVDGNVTFKIDSIVYDEVLIENNLIIQEIKDIDAGNYSVKITYNGNNNYNSKTYNVKLTINKISTTVIGTADDITFSETATINVKPSVDGNVIVKIDGNYIDNINAKSNTVTPITFENIPAGKHNITITLKPTNKNYEESSYKTDFTVSKKETSINLNVVDSVYGKDVIVNVTASDDGKVILNVGEITREKNVLANIQTTINLGVLSAKSYDAEVIFNAGDNYKTSTQQKSFAITPAKAEITAIQVQNNTYGENTIINVKTNVTGVLTVKLNNANAQTFNINANKLTSLDLGKYDADNYDIDLSLDAGSNYSKATGNAKITVNPKQTTVELKVNDNVYGKNVIVNVTASENGKVTVNVGTNVRIVDVEANKLTSVDFGILDAKSYDVNATFDGGKNYQTSFDKDSLLVSPKASSVTMVDFVNSYVYAQNVIIKMKTDADGTLTVKVGDTPQTKQVTAGSIVSFDFGILNVNTYGVTINLDAGNNYIPYQNTTSIAITPKSTSIVLNTKDYDTSENVIVNVTASENGKVTIKLGNLNKTIDVNANEITSVDFGLLDVGSYNVVANFTAGNNYINSTATCNVKVLSKINDDDVNITIPEIVANQENQIVVNLPSNATGTVTLIIGNNTYPFTVNNGVATVKVPKLEDGTYEYVIKYSGDNNYSSFRTSGNIDVSKPTPDVEIPPLDKPSSDGSVTINLPQGATGTVTLVIDKKPYSFPVQNGVAKIYMPDLANGNYQYTITYSGDGKYSAFTKEGSLNVNKQSTPAKPVTKTTLTLKKVKVKKSAKKLTIQATLKVNGKSVKGKIIKFKFNKKTYKARTNAKGVAKITVKKSVLKKLKKGKKVTYTATYDKITKKVTVKVK